MLLSQDVTLYGGLTYLVEKLHSRYYILLCRLSFNAIRRFIYIWWFNCNRRDAPHTSSRMRTAALRCRGYIEVVLAAQARAYIGRAMQTIIRLTDSLLCVLSRFAELLTRLHPTVRAVVLEDAGCASVSQVPAMSLFIILLPLCLPYIHFIFSLHSFTSFLLKDVFAFLADNSTTSLTFQNHIEQYNY